MNDLQQKALTACHSKLLKDLELDPELVGKLIHHGIFNDDMIERFQSFSTRREQISQMLRKLPRRGPRAFELFLLCIQDHWPWLAEDLRDTLNKISNNKDSEHVSLRDKTDIFVHETFGNSRRFCEEDKKKIRNFLYKHLKEAANLDHVEIAQEEREAIEKETERQLCQELLPLFDSQNNIDDAESDRMSEDSTDESMEFSIDNIKNKLNNMKAELDSYKQEVETCYSVLGLGDCDYPLHDVLATYKEKMTNESTEMKDKCEELQDKIAFLEKRCNRLQEKLYNKDQELKKMTNNNIEIKDSELKALRAKCFELEKEKRDWEEKQISACKTLEDLVINLCPTQRQHQNDSGLKYDKTDGCSAKCELPPINVRSSQTHQQSYARRSREISSSNHEFSAGGRRSAYGQPWK